MKKKCVSENFLRGSIIFTTVIAVIIIGCTTIPVLAAKPQLSDRSIADAVEDELLMDSAVPSYLIDVAVTDGIVTLSGRTDNILAKERAARIARIVKGVRAVVNEIRVDPPLLRTDQEIRENVIAALLTDPATDSYEVDVAVNRNGVTLTGTVDSWQEKILCATVAKGVKGVKGVTNKIRVTSPQHRSDEEIRAEVEKTLQWDAFVDHALIHVTVRDSKVFLSGVVGSAAEKRWAHLDAHVQGVNSVDDSMLEVKRWARDPDLKGDKYTKKSGVEIEAAVKDALLADPRVFSFNLRPEVAEDGTTVILRGTVDNLKARRAAAQDARNTVGVRQVENRIKVRPVEILSDEKIEEKISSALMRDPYVESYEISVDVINGVARLYGTVDSYFEKARADDVASRVNGVIVVDNALIVEKDYERYMPDPFLDGGYLSDYDWYRYRPRYTVKSDRQIKADIEDELFWSPFVDADDVKVTVEDGKATLTGTVGSWSEYGAAQDNAYEGGAVNVDNDLIVTSPKA
jgi:osmotically-inducible protein OsmY